MSKTLEELTRIYELCICITLDSFFSKLPYKFSTFLQGPKIKQF